MSKVEQWNKNREQLALLRETIENCGKVQNIVETCIYEASIFLPENIADRYLLGFLLY